MAIVGGFVCFIAIDSELYGLLIITVIFCFFWYIYLIAHKVYEEFAINNPINLERSYRINSELQDKVNELQNKLVKLENAEQRVALYEQILKERASGFPTLFKILYDYEEAIDNHFAGYFVAKPRPALKTAQVLKEESKKRREAEFLQRRAESIVEFYEQVAPHLIDLKNEEFGEDDESDIFREYTEKEISDPVSHYLTKKEYRSLSSVERNQMALDRYWQRKKSKRALGNMYERYIGYILENDGYAVRYTGITDGVQDLGRDLICQKGNEILIVQCKNWSKFKTIFEKHIFQLFGTSFQHKYEMRHNKKNIKSVFYTTTKLSELAKKFAKELNIEVRENFKMDTNYPCIKCNVSEQKGTKIYHLPFDQQYDRTKINISEGDFYCTTVAEAETKGFRRAFRWRGIKSK